MIRHSCVHSKFTALARCETFDDQSQQEERQTQHQRITFYGSESKSVKIAFSSAVIATPYDSKHSVRFPDTK